MSNAHSVATMIAPSPLARTTYEYEYRACIGSYLHGRLPPDEAHLLLQKAKALTVEFAAVVGVEEAYRVSARLLERVACVFVPEQAA